VLIFVPDHHQSASFVFYEDAGTRPASAATTSRARCSGFVFGIGLLMAQYTYTGYDASAHMSEETRQASRAAAIGVVMSVVMSVIFGFILLVAVTFAVTDVQGTVNAGAFDVQYIWQHALGTPLGGVHAVDRLRGAVLLRNGVGDGCLGMMFAFSRDGAVPGGRQFFRKVSRRYRVPVNAVLAIAVLSWALMLPTLANGAIGYLVGTSIAVHRPLHRVRRADLSALARGRCVRGGRLVAREALQVDQPDRGALDRVHRDPVPAATVPTAIPWHRRLQLERRQLRTNHRGRCTAPSSAWWWLVSAHKWFKGPVREAARRSSSASRPTWEASAPRHTSPREPRSHVVAGWAARRHPAPPSRRNGAAVRLARERDPHPLLPRLKRVRRTCRESAAEITAKTGRAAAASKGRRASSTCWTETR